MIDKILRKLKGNGVQNDFVNFEGIKLPYSRSNENLSNNRSYIESGIEQINHLLRFELINNNTKILDFGCGQGRLLNSLIYSKTDFQSYIGLDTSKKAIEWCEKHLCYHDKISFIHLPAENARYNPSEKGLKPLPLAENEIDLIFLNSVFSHMLDSDISFYLSEFHKVLTSNGRVYLTAFVEENVPDMEENPKDYLDKSVGALHRVRFEKEFFFTLVKKANFEVTEFHHQLIDRTKQSVFVLRKR
ncbi:class I SAM-dependent methyltransferase [Pontibacter sp. G13]|uniref:class I SAM-dependent methyltransferase n=1 Tax=Pontibacter sp. G13 TaxID=3074898 RepID=UPI00288B6E23|nr:class I SAM-dependent methyltransferase [Pontibacter sp. G13]WNJ18256.1 class I SAM-dependent methyltransferase [Pontibacter sp. G13]